MARDVKTEAGHRCAIPTCRQPAALQIHHIVDYSKVQEHTFDNLLLLCANCHSRVTNGETDTLSVKRYKSNLSVLNSRYGDTERRVLEYFALTGATEVAMAGNHLFDLMYLVRAGLVVLGRQFGTGRLPGGQLVTKLPLAVSEEGSVRIPKINIPDDIAVDHSDYYLTDKGCEFGARWLSANDI